MPRRWLEELTDVANEEDVGSESLRRVSLIKGFEDPAVFCQRQSFRGRAATGESPGSASTVMGRASRKVMHEGAVRGRRDRWKDLAGPAGKTQKRKGSRRQIKGVHGVLPDREEVVRECQRGHHADQKP